VAEGPVARFPSLGQHSDEVLREIELSDAEIADLREKKVIA